MDAGDIQSGAISRAAMIIDGQDIGAGPGDIFVIGPETPHRFTAVGEERLVAVCIYASDRFVIEWLGAPR